MSTARHPDGAAEQLALLPVAEIPLQFRLPERTRRIGLANIAGIKAMLAEQEARRLEREGRHRRQTTQEAA